MDSPYLSASECQTDMINVSDKPAEESDMNIKRVGIDLAKSVFQIHGVDDQEKVVLRKQLRSLVDTLFNFKLNFANFYYPVHSGIA